MAEKAEGHVEPEEIVQEKEEKTPPKKESKAVEGSKYDGGPIPRS